MSSSTEYEYIFGVHAVRQSLEHNLEHVVEIWLQQGSNAHKLAEVLDYAQKQGLHVQRVPRKTLDKLTHQAVHQGIVIRCRAKTRKIQFSLEDCLARLTVPPLLLVLDGVQDPHNLGACLRTADAAGVHAVIVPQDRACSLTATVRKVACGGAESVPFFQVSNLATTLRWLKAQGIWLIGTSDKSQTSLYAPSLCGAIAFVLGAEGTGLRRLTRESCDSLVHIPMLGSVECLNVSVATGVCLYEAVRQRQLDNNRR